MPKASIWELDAFPMVSVGPSGWPMFAYWAAFPLSDPSGITVFVDGKAVTNWHYDAGANYCNQLLALSDGVTLSVNAAQYDGTEPKLCDMVTAANPCFITSAAVVSRMASSTAWRWASIVWSHSLGMRPI